MTQSKKNSEAHIIIEQTHCNKNWQGKFRNQICMLQHQTGRIEYVAFTKQSRSRDGKNS